TTVSRSLFGSTRMQGLNTSFAIVRLRMLSWLTSRSRLLLAGSWAATGTTGALEGVEEWHECSSGQSADRCAGGGRSYIEWRPSVPCLRPHHRGRRQDLVSAGIAAD